MLLKKVETKPQTLSEYTLFVFSHLTVVPDYLISEISQQKAKDLCNDIDIKDSVYVALTIQLEATLLTRDKVLFDGLQSKGFSNIVIFDDFVRKLYD